jgi:hypothetical protein
VYTGKEVARLSGHRGDVETLTFAAGGNRLISGSSDTTALVWDVAAVRKVKEKQPPGAKLKTAEVLWKHLLGDDATRAWETIRVLEASPKTTLALFKDKLRPAAGVDEKHLAQLLGDLGDDVYKVRQGAFQELQKLGELAEPALNRFLKEQSPPLEARQRIQKLLAKLGSSLPSGEQLRTCRALEVLEHLGTKEAREVLGSLAKGVAGAQLTREAQQILERLDRQALAQP